MTAYFTEPMSEEFKKAMEEAMKDINDDGKPKEKKKPSRPSGRTNRSKDKVSKS